MLGRTLREAACRRFFSSNPARAAAVEASDSAKTASLSRLERLRAQITDGPTLQEFATPSFEEMRGRSEREAQENMAIKDPPKPSWLRIDTPTGKKRETFEKLSNTVKSLNLATVCEEAKCPNIGSCWGGSTTEEKGDKHAATATIMLMGDTCTRGCSFCAIKTSRTPPPLDPNEPKRVAEAIASWDIGYVVLTSVDRDDLADQGSNHFASTVRHLKASVPGLLVECLTPDFQGKSDLIATVAQSGLDVFAHNVETVERLQSRVRDRRAGYKQSMYVLEHAKVAEPRVLTKTSLMLGVGETEEDIRKTLVDLRNSGVDVVTFGQYLRPTKRHMPVDRYVTPEEFEMWQKEGEAMGFLYVASGPLVRSSYKAGEYFLEAAIRGKLPGVQAADTIAARGSLLL